METWRHLIEEQFNLHNEWFQDISSIAPSFDVLNVPFDYDNGEKGPAFTVWTKERVYFPATYDGNQWVASVSRDPDMVATDHVGGH